MIVGIDLGTTNTSICYYKNGKPYFIKDQNNHNISTIVGITNFGNVFGNQAKSLKDSNIFISNLKRLIGYKYNELDKNYYSQFSYDIVDQNNDIKIKINDCYYYPSELIIYFLNYLKTLIDKCIDSEYKVIVAVPAYFSVHQKEIINDCVKNAGFNLLKLLNEPTAAAISYGSFITFNDDDNILIFDLGGGTLDLSLIKISMEKEEDTIYEVIGTYGDNCCGGSDITFLLLNYIKIKYPNYLFDNNNIFEHVDKIKIALSNGSEFANLTNNIIITYEEFDIIVKKWLEKVDFIKSINNVLQLANLSKDKVNHVLLVGGATKLKHIKILLESYFNKYINDYFINNIDVKDIAVSNGTALHGHILTSNKNIVLIDVCPFTIGIETLTQISEDEIGNIMTPIIMRNSQIPISKTQQFTTQENDTENVIIKIFQGESKLTKNNIYLGEFSLNGITKAPKGVPVINVNIMIDHNGLLQITAWDRKNFINNQITISAKDYKLSDDESNIIRENMLKTKDNEITLFELIEIYNNFMLIFEKLVFNLIVNPINKFKTEYINDIKNNLYDNILKICKCIKDHILPISFNSFEDLVIMLYDNLPYNTNEIIYKNIIVYLRILFYDSYSFIMDNYRPLVSNYDDINYEKNKTDAADITDEKISRSNDCDINKEIMASKLDDIINDRIDIEKTKNDIKVYEIIELLEQLLQSINDDVIELSSEDKTNIIEYIYEVQNNINNYSIEMINEYCANILTKYQ